MHKIKVAQIGTSLHSHGNNIFESMIRQSDLFDIVGYALPENEKEKFPERAKLFENYKELSVADILHNDEIEAVAIETEEEYLCKYAVLAAEHKKHIHMEKPGGQDLSEFEKLISLQKRNGKTFQTGYMYRYNPFVKDLLQRIRRGALGEIISVEAQMNCLHDERTREHLSRYRGGMMFFLGCHLIDLVLQICGIPDRIIPLNKSTGFSESGSTDFGMAVFEYKNGISFVKTCSLEPGGFSRRHLVVNGTKGSVEIRPLEIFTEVEDVLRSGKTEYTDLSAGWDYTGEYSESLRFYRYDEMMAEFARMINGEIVNPHTCDYELELYRTLLKCCEVN